MSDIRRVLKPSVWVFYAVFVLEILFMISPAALYFYGVYGPMLNLFHRWAATAWLTQFFLPHFSETRSAMLNGLHWLAGPLMLAGIVVFFAGAIPVYWTKLRGGGAITTGVYAWIRHPQYVGARRPGAGDAAPLAAFSGAGQLRHHAVPVRAAGGMGGAVCLAVRRDLPELPIENR